MTTLTNALRILVELFVDDGALAIAIVVVVTLSAALAAMLPGQPTLAGIVLLGGCLAVLVTNVMLAVQRRA
jgi:hypothetical protein